MSWNERFLGKATPESKILRYAVKSSKTKKTDLTTTFIQSQRYGIKSTCRALKSAGPNIMLHLSQSQLERKCYSGKAADNELVEQIKNIIKTHPTYGYYRVWPQ